MLEEQSLYLHNRFFVSVNMRLQVMHGAISLLDNASVNKVDQIKGRPIEEEVVRSKQ